jgi:hydroxyquinol 1,2-dioxygenase
LNKLTCRARLRTDEQGRFWFRAIVPAFYPIPNDGPVGKMLEAQGRHPFRPAHVHFLISAPGCETLVTHLSLADDKCLNSDVVFGVKDSLICRLGRQASGLTPGGHETKEATALLRYDFVLAAAAEAR